MVRTRSPSASTWRLALGAHVFPELGVSVVDVVVVLRVRRLGVGVVVIVPVGRHGQVLGLRLLGDVKGGRQDLRRGDSLVPNH